MGNGDWLTATHRIACLPNELGVALAAAHRSLRWAPPNMVLKLPPRPGVMHIAQELRRPRRSLKPIR
jgi:hypothetical protein